MLDSSLKNEKQKRKKLDENHSIEEERKEINEILLKTHGKEYEIEKILMKKTIKGKNLYLVKWKGWDEEFEWDWRYLPAYHQIQC